MLTLLHKLNLQFKFTLRVHLRLKCIYWNRLWGRIPFSSKSIFVYAQMERIKKVYFTNYCFGLV